jgi:hypothetical protein
VLERVRDSLKPLLGANPFDFTAFKKTIPKYRARNEDRPQPPPLRNLFEVLDVYEPSAEFLNAPDVTLPPRAELEFTVEVPNEPFFKALLAMTALLDDLSRLGAEIQQLWAKYSEGELDLAAVFVATNTAIELARTL